jgi:hypothetical protein
MRSWDEVHRDDGELVGYLSREDRDGRPTWIARALFGGELARFAERTSAADFLRARGLPLLAEKWWYRSDEGAEWRLTFLIEARLGAVRVRFGYDSHPSNVADLRGAQLDRLTLHRAAEQRV